MRHAPERSASPSAARRPARVGGLTQACALLLVAGTVLGGASATLPVGRAAPAAAADACAVGTSARIPGPPPALAAMGIGAVDDRPTGKGVIVAIVDSGVDGTRPQLSSAFAPGSTSLVADDQPGDGLSDVHGHGTAIAGVIAARPSPESGVVGVAPDAEIVSIRVFRGDDDTLREQGLGPEASRTAAGIRAGVDAGAKIIVVALSDDEDVPVTRAAVEYAAASGALVVASAGNAATTDNPSDEPRYPAAYPDVLAVTAVDENGLPTSDSIHGNHIDVAAPGQNVLTTATGAGDCIYAQDAPAASFATAYAAGAAALLVERFPEEGPEGWAYRLKATADRANPDAADALIGWGRVQPMLALQLRPDSTTRGPASPFVDNSSSAIAPQPTSVSAAEPGPDSTPFVAGIAAAALALLATLSVLGRLRRRR